MGVRVTTLTDIRAEGVRDLFPTEKLAGMESALVLFAAAFMGRQDAIWIEEAGMVATCVDNDAEALTRMEAIYPDTWDFFCADAYWYATTTGDRWDVVTVDCPTGYFEQAAEHIKDWCVLARHVVILGTDTDTPIEPPDGWQLVERRRRSDYAGGVYWAVLEAV